MTGYPYHKHPTVKRYDWDKDDDDGGWGEPMSHPERLFWRGVLIGGLIEAFFVLLVVFLIWLVRF